MYGTIAVSIDFHIVLSLFMGLNSLPFPPGHWLFLASPPAVLMWSSPFLPCTLLPRSQIRLSLPHPHQLEVQIGCMRSWTPSNSYFCARTTVLFTASCLTCARVRAWWPELFPTGSESHLLDVTLQSKWRINFHFFRKESWQSPLITP